VVQTELEELEWEEEPGFFPSEPQSPRPEERPSSNDRYVGENTVPALLV